MTFGPLTAAQADVNFRANVGQFRGDTAAIRELARQTYGSISESSQRAAIASERYDRALLRAGNSSFAANKATLAYRKEMDAIALSSGPRLTGAVSKEEQSLGRLTRGAVVGSGAMRGLGRAVSYASTAFLGGVGLAYAIRSVVSAAQQQQTAVAQVAGALKQQGVSWEANRAQIAATIAEQEHLSSFTKTELYNSFSLLFRRTGDVNQALKDNVLAVDVARGGHKELDVAIKLVNSSLLGQARGLKPLGIDIPKVTSHVDALKASTLKQTTAQLAAAKAADKQSTADQIRAAILAKYGGAAAAFSKSEVGRQLALKNAIHDTEVAIGDQLLPTVTRLETHLTRWLSDSQNQARVQRDVQTVIKTTGDAVHVLSDGFQIASKILSPFNDLLGGTEHTMRLIAISLLLIKTRALLASRGILGIGVASTTAAAETTVAAGVIEGDNAAITASARIAATAEGSILLPSGATLLPTGNIIPAAAGPSLFATAGLGVFGKGGILGTGLRAGGFGALLAYSEKGEMGSTKNLVGPLEISLHFFGGRLLSVGYKDPITGRRVYIATDIKTITAAQLQTMVESDMQRHHTVADIQRALGIRAPARGVPAAPAPPGGLPAAVGAGKVVQQARRLGVGSGGVYSLGGGHMGVAKPGTKLDCSGYVYQVFTQSGFKGFPGDSDHQWYTMKGPNWSSSVVSPAAALPGDVVFSVGADSARHRGVGHVGIVTGGSGLGATVMQYYSSGKPADTIPLSAIGDLVGVKRFFLVKAGSSTGGSTGGGGKPLSLQGQYNLAENKLAAAQASGDVRGQRAALLAERTITQAMLKHPGTLANSTALLNQLTSINDQIKAIDEASKKVGTKKESAEEKRLTSIPYELRRQELLAKAQGASDSKLLGIYKKELAALKEQLKVIQQRKLGRDAILKNLAAEDKVKKEIDAINKKTSGPGGDFFAQAVQEFSLYGSNIGRGLTPLSPQDARALLALEAIARSTKTTAAHTKTLVKATPKPISGARAMALLGNL